MTMVIIYDNIEEEQMMYDVEFYIKSNGRIPVQDFLYSLEPKLRAKAFMEIKLLYTMGDMLR